MNINSALTYEFTIADAQVSAMKVVIGNKTIALQLPSNTTFSVDATTVTETISGTTGIETLQFVQDPLHAGTYHLGSESLQITAPTTTSSHGATFGYAFSISNNAVTGMQIQTGDADHPRLHTLAIPPNASFEVNGDTVTETLVYGNVVEKVDYVLSNQPGLYALAAESDNFVQPGAALTRLNVDPQERNTFTFDANHAITQVQAVRADGSQKTITPGADTTFSLLENGYVLASRSNGSHSSYEVFHDGNGDGIYTEVAQGHGSSVDLVGLKAQINATIDALL